VGTPTAPLALVPAATALGAEIHRHEIPASQTVLDTIEVNRGRETTYTTVSGEDLPGTPSIGEAGIFATVTDPGTTPLAIGYQFLIAQAHFGRLCLTAYDRLAIKWPIDYSP
jgi:hypothetical protein